MSKFSQILLAIILLLGGVVFIQYKHSARLSDERDRYKQNNTALLSDIERMQVDSTTMAVDAKALRLTIDEYERFRAADAEKIRLMGVKIKDLQAAAKHQLEVAAPINAVIRDTVFICDTVPVIQQKVEMVSPHISLTQLLITIVSKVISVCPLLYNRPYGSNTSVNVSFGRRLKQSTRPYRAIIPMSISNTPNTYK